MSQSVRSKLKRPMVKPRYGYFWVHTDDGTIGIETLRGAGIGMASLGRTVRRLLICDPPKRKGKR